MVSSSRKLTIEASLYFTELCGKKEITHLIDNLKGDADTLIQLASIFRQKNEKIESLKNRLARFETSQATESRKWGKLKTDDSGSTKKEVNKDTKIKKPSPGNS